MDFFMNRIGLVFISIGSNKVSDSIDDVHSVSVTAIYDSINYMNDTLTVCKKQLYSAV